MRTVDENVRNKPKRIVTFRERGDFEEEQKGTTTEE